MAIVVDAKETPDRDGYLADGRALWGQEGVGAGSVAPNLTLAAQGVEPHHGCLLLPASWALAATLLRAPYPLNLHTGLAMLAWPSISETIFGFTFLRSRIVAAVWRNWWNV